MNDIPMNVNLRTLENLLPSLQGQQKKLTEYIIKNYDTIGHINITYLAEQSHTSGATVTRLSRLLGYDSFQSFKIALVQNIDSFPTILYPDFDENDSMEDLVKKVFHSDMEAINTTYKVIDFDELKKAVLLIRDAKRFELYGFGTSGAVVYDAGQRFFKIGRFNHVITDNDFQALSASLLDERDVVLAVSHTGRNAALLQNIGIAKKVGAKIISITQHGKSPLQSLSDVVLYTSSRETAFKSDAMSSRIAQMAILDVLYVALGFMNYEESYKKIKTARAATDSKKVAQQIL